MNKPVAGFTSEFIGAFALMFIGGGAMFCDLGLVGVALAHGLALGSAVTALMHISGGQFNPAVSIALSVIRKQSWAVTALYIVAQCAGSAAAAFLLSHLYPAVAVESHNLGATIGLYAVPDAAGALPNLWKLMTLEFIATFFLMTVVIGSAVDPRGVGNGAKVGGFAIGLIVTACILAIGPFTGASMNPSRSFGPALVGGYWHIHYAYWLAPIAGAVVAALIWRTLLGGKDAR